MPSPFGVAEDGAGSVQLGAAGRPFRTGQDLQRQEGRFYGWIPDFMEESGGI